MHQHAVMNYMHQLARQKGAPTQLQQEPEQIGVADLFMLLFLCDIFYFLLHVLHSFVCSFSALFSSHKM